MSKNCNQKIGDIIKSNKVSVEQTQDSQKPRAQEVGNIENSEDVDIRQIAETLNQLPNAEKYIIPLQEGLKEYIYKILPRLSLQLENYKQMHQEIQEIVERLNNSELGPKPKLKIAIPIIPTILSLESEYNISEKLKHAKEFLDDSSLKIYQKLLKIASKLKQKLNF